jgi:hypothetical protein
LIFIVWHLHISSLTILAFHPIPTSYAPDKKTLVLLAITLDCIVDGASRGLSRIFPVQVGNHRESI